MLTNREYREDGELDQLKHQKAKFKSLKTPKKAKSMIRKINQQAIEKMRIPIGIKSYKRPKKTQ